jgi:fatty-acyl-CoA synthase
MRRRQLGDKESAGRVEQTIRTKDVIKSGGEWISSIDIENAAMLHPRVRFAAAVGVYHPKWDERGSGSALRRYLGAVPYQAPFSVAPEPI